MMAHWPYTSAMQQSKLPKNATQARPQMKFDRYWCSWSAIEYPNAAKKMVAEEPTCTNARNTVSIRKAA